MLVLRKVLLLAVLLMPVLSHPATAAELSLGVDPLVVEFSAGPGGSAHASVVVNNAGSDAERVMMMPIDWRTLVDGNIALERAGTEGSRSLTSSLTLSASGFVLQPGEARTLTLTLAMPQSKPSTPASYWGGFLIEATRPTGSDTGLAPGATVFVYDNVGQPHRHLSLRSLDLVGTGTQTRVEARLVNDVDSYLRIASHMVVRRGNHVVRDVDVPMNSILPRAERLLQQPLQGLAAGGYRLELTFDYGGETILDGVKQIQIR